MFIWFLLALAICLGAVGARAQTAQQVITGYLTTSGCPSVATTPCFVQYGSGGSGPGANVVITGPLGVQSAAASVAVVCNSGCSGAADESPYNVGSSTFQPSGGFFQITPTSGPLTNGQGGWVQMTSTRSFFVNLRNAAGTEIGTSSNPVNVTGATSNASSGVATSSTNLPSVAYNYGFNGTTWDQLQVDASKNLLVSTNPIAVAPTVGASGAITSLVLKASATTSGVKHFHAENATTTSGYCILYNATSAPGTGALTANLVLKFQLLPPSGYCDWQSNSVDPPIAASTGAVLLVSSASTPYTYTTGVTTASMEGLAQ